MTGVADGLSSMLSSIYQSSTGAGIPSNSRSDVSCCLSSKWELFWLKVVASHEDCFSNELSMLKVGVSYQGVGGRFKGEGGFKVE